MKNLIHTLAMIFAILFFIEGALAVSEKNQQYQEEITNLQVEINKGAEPKEQERLAKIIAVYEQAMKQESRIEHLRSAIHDQKQRVEKAKSVEPKLRSEFEFINYEKATADELSRAVVIEKTNVLGYQQDKEQLKNAINNNDEYLSKLRADLIEIKQDDLNDYPVSLEMKKALFALQTAKIETLELEILDAPIELEVNRIRLKKLARLVDASKERIAMLENKVQDQRVKELANIEVSVDQQKNIDISKSAIASYFEKNRFLAEQYKANLQLLDKVSIKSQKIEREFEILEQSFTAIEQQIEINPSALGLEFRRFERKLLAVNDVNKTKEYINRLRMQNISLEQGENIKPDGSYNYDELQLFDILKNNHQEIVTQLREVNNQAITSYSTLLTQQEKINKLIERSELLISENMLWIPSAEPVSVNWLRDIKNGIGHFNSLIVPDLNKQWLLPESRWLKYSPLLIISVIVSLLALRFYLKQRPHWLESINHFKNERFIHTLHMVWLPIAIALPFGVFVYLFNDKVVDRSTWRVDLDSLSLLFGISTIIYVVLLLWLKRQKGLMVKYFGLRPIMAKMLAQVIHILFWVCVPLSALLIVVDQSDVLVLRSGIGRLLLISLAVLFIFISTVTLLRVHRIYKQSELSWWLKPIVWMWLFIVVEVAVIAFALLGYIYTGGYLQVMFIAILAVVFLSSLIYLIGNHALVITARRLVYERVMKKMESSTETPDDNQLASSDEIVIDEDEIDISVVSEQVRVLLKIVTIGVLVGLLAMILQQALPSLNIMDEVTLWTSDVETAAGIIENPITLKNVIFSIIILALGVMAAYNLPGLIDLFILRYLPITTGTAFAITTITKYILIVISVSLFASGLGLQWSKLQWLVAALGVGLGFGLQEIVANFVSGLIILFEKPIRIGDMVTIGGYTGHVSKIHIRATTIVDLDRREVIIPNKNFVTDQLINWSLSDSIFRVIVRVGVAYGNDTKLAQQLLLRAANEHPRVLSEPKPEAFFLEFADSSLNLELRCFIPAVSQRFAVHHELNSAIDQLFKEHNLCIAFPQMDVHIIPPEVDSDENK